MSWNREYTSRSPMTVGCFFGGVLLFMGLIFSVLFGIAGLLIILLGIAIPVLAWYLGTAVTITCSDQGFTVQTRSQRTGTQAAQYGWHEVTATNYYETTHSSRHGRTTTAHYEVETVRGRAFSITQTLGNYRDLIEVCNNMAPQVPYVWKPRTGFSFNLGPLTVHRGAYVSVPRDQMQQQ